MKPESPRPGAASRAFDATIRGIEAVAIFLGAMAALASCLAPRPGRQAEAPTSSISSVPIPARLPTSGPIPASTSAPASVAIPPAGTPGPLDVVAVGSRVELVELVDCLDRPALAEWRAAGNKVSPGNATKRCFRTPWGEPATVLSIEGADLPVRPDHSPWPDPTGWAAREAVRPVPPAEELAGGGLDGLPLGKRRALYAEEARPDLFSTWAADRRLPPGEVRSGPAAYRLVAEALRQSWPIPDAPKTDSGLEPPAGPAPTLAQRIAQVPAPKDAEARAGADVAPGRRWQVVAIDEAEATVEMPPGPVEKHAAAMKGPQGVYELSSRIVEAGGMIYEAHAFEGPEVIPEADAAGELGRARDFVLSTYGAGEVTSDRPIRSQAGAGREFTATVSMRGVDRLPARGRAYIAGRWIYVVIANPTASGEKLPAEAGRFLDSLARIGRGGQGVAKPLRAWGTVVNPDGNAEVEAWGRSLMILLPGTPHVLSAEFGKFNAPRVVTPIRGDFAATVRVEGRFDPGRVSTAQGLPARQAGGLLLWKDDANYVVLQHGAVGGERDQPKCQVTLDRRQGGRGGEGRDHPAPAGPVLLRLESKRGRVAGSFRVDGREWESFEAFDAPWVGGEVQLGVIAVNTSTGSHSVTFEDYLLEAR